MTDPLQEGIAEALSRWSLGIHVGMAIVLLLVNIGLLTVARREAILTWVVAWSANVVALGAVLAYVLIIPDRNWFILYGTAKLSYALLLLRGILLFKMDRLAMARLSRNWAIGAGLAFGILLYSRQEIEVQALVYLVVGAVLVGGALIIGGRLDKGRAWFLVLATAATGGLYIHHGLVLIEGIFTGSAPLYMNYISFVDVFGEFLIGISCLLALGQRAVAEMARVNESLETSQRALRALVDADPLTGLYNRRRLRDFLDSAEEAGGSLIYFDVNNFKGINDRWGHSTGDQALCRIAEAMREVFRSEDGLFRLGGDEFLVVAPGLPPEAVKDRIDGLRRMLESGVDGVFQISIAAGVVFLRPGVQMEEALVAADDAMYRDKFSHGAV